MKSKKTIQMLKNKLTQSIETIHTESDIYVLEDVYNEHDDDDNTYLVTINTDSNTFQLRMNKTEFDQYNIRCDESRCTCDICTLLETDDGNVPWEKTDRKVVLEPEHVQFEINNYLLELLSVCQSCDDKDEEKKYTKQLYSLIEPLEMFYQHIKAVKEDFG